MIKKFNFQSFSTFLIFLYILKFFKNFSFYYLNKCVINKSNLCYKFAIFFFKKFFNSKFTSNNLNFKVFKKICKLNVKKCNNIFIKKINKIQINLFKINLYFLENFICINYKNIYLLNNKLNFIFLKKNFNLFNYCAFFIKLNLDKNILVRSWKKSKKITFEKVNFFIKDFYILNLFKLSNYISNKFLNAVYNNHNFYIYTNKFNKLFFFLKNYNNNDSFHYFNNYYPIFFKKSLLNFFLKNFKYNYKTGFLVYTNKIVLNFLENFLNKKFFVKISNNKHNKIKNKYFYNILNENKFYQPIYFNKFLLTDFIEIIWYSFLLKDLKILSNWISIFMESLNFKNHKKFLVFFNNFLNKYSGLFIDVLKIKGFFFDIRGKVGVTGSSKKRHTCFKFGILNKSLKSSKIEFNQNLIRTYSGVMGVTYIINY